LKDCRARLASTTSAPAQGGFAPAAPAPAPAPVAPATGYVKTASQCDAEYAANKAAIRASGQTKREFVAACRQGSETIPQGAAAAPAPAPAPAQTGSLFPWHQPAAPASAPAPSSYGTPAPTGDGQFASAQEAQSRCPGATVVWVNARPTLRRPVVGRRRTSGILRGDTGSSGERHKRADSQPIGVAQGTARIGRRPGIGRYGVPPHLRPLQTSSFVPHQRCATGRCKLSFSYCIRVSRRSP
jgi:hypothetical protein